MTDLKFNLSPNTQYCFLWNSLQTEGYKFLQSDIFFKSEDILKEFLATVPHELIADFRPFNEGTSFIIDDIFIQVFNSRNTYLFSKRSLKELGDFVTKHKKFFCSNASRSINITYYYSEGKTQSQRVSLDLDKLSYTYPQLYPDIDIELLDKEFAKSTDSILVLYGAPGVGKTTFLKYILNTGSYKNALYTKDMNVLKDSSFWCGLVGSTYGVMILDDLDFALNPRRSGQDSDFVSNLLSYSDGIFEQRSKIIITTNQPISEMDEALVRPGRCFDFLTLEPLTQRQAQLFWTDTLKRPITEYCEYINHNADVVTQAEVMNAHRRLSAGISRSYMRNGNTTSLEDRLTEAGVAIGGAKMAPFS